ncbi:MAG: amino acid ABC transporter permease [Actinomycetota bacterium]
MSATERITAWMKANLFRSVADSIVSVVLGALAAFLLFRIVRFVFVTGRWEIVEVNLSLYITGAWPDAETWRLVTVVLFAGFVGGIIVGFVTRTREIEAGIEPGPPDVRTRAAEIVARLWPLLLGIGLLLLLSRTIMPTLLVLGLVGVVVVGRFLGRRLPQRGPTPLAVLAVLTLIGMVWLMANGVGLESWGGVLLNLFLAAFSITLCFPLGVLLALGRRSKFPIIRLLSVGYIELFRGAPLIALLLMANVTIGFFVPQSIVPSTPVRAIIVFTLFTAAYMAEVVRGGLQSVPSGQFEAAKALGLSPISTTFRIVLPQALRNVIPAIVGQFISLFKDTTLAGAAMGLAELLNAAQASTAQEQFRGQGLIVESLVFVLFLFWVGAFTMSRESQRLERRLGVGNR